MSERFLLNPDELARELAKAYPEPRVRRIPSPRVPYVTYSNENLYGVVVYVIGEGVRGQFLRHEYFTREMDRYWAIRLGWVTLYGRLKKEKGGVVIPLVVMGVPTRYVFQYNPRDFDEYLLEEVPTGYLEVKETQIINLERCTQGRDPVMIVDKYGILRHDGFSTPSEVIDKIVEQQKIIEGLQKSLWEYEKNIHDLEASAGILRAENAKLRELVRSFKIRFQKLASEVTSVQMELLRLREDMKVRGMEAEVTEKTERALRNIVDSLEDLLGELQRDIRLIEETREREEEKKRKRGKEKKEVKEGE